MAWWKRVLEHWKERLKIEEDGNTWFEETANGRITMMITSNLFQSTEKVSNLNRIKNINDGMKYSEPKNRESIKERKILYTCTNDLLN